MPTIIELIVTLRHSVAPKIASLTQADEFEQYRAQEFKDVRAYSISSFSLFVRIGKRIDLYIFLCFFRQIILLIERGNRVL